MKKAIVTGANGFIGRWLIKELQRREVEVIAVIRNKESKINFISDNVKIVYCELDSISDLSNLIEDRDVDVFYHLAWSGTAGKSRADYSMQLCNVKYACDGATVAKKIGCQKFIGIGTITENIAQNILNIPAKAENTIYGIAKHTTHCMLDIVCKNIKLDYVWAQLSNIYGPDNTTGNIISYTLSELKNGNRPTFSKANQPYDLMSVEDTAVALSLLGEKSTTKNQYFIGSGEPKILCEYLLSIGSIYGDRGRIGIGERPDDGLAYDLAWFDTTDLETDTGFKTKKSFEDNMEEIIKSMT
jgi:nucleoside-diphosphate-sugar epimerase